MTWLHEGTLTAGLEIAERNRKRLADSGEPGVEVRSIQAFFDPPEQEGGD